jgi:hypothetical protein
MIPAGLTTVMLVLGAIFVLVGQCLARRADAPRSWPRTEGVVTTNYVTTVEARDTKTGHTYDRTMHVLEYAYEVDGRAYTNDLFAFGVVSTPLEDDGRFLEGAKVPVYYDPADPGTAVLVVDVEDPAPTFRWVGIGTMLLGTPFAYLAYRLARARPKS